MGRRVSKPGAAQGREAMKKPRLRVSSARWIWAIHENIVACKIRGRLDRFHDVAADVLDGRAIRKELDDLIRRGMLKVVRHGFDDSLGRDPLRDSEPLLCGVGWSVNPTERLIRTFWPDRLK